MNIHYKYKAAPPLKGTPIRSNLSLLPFFSQKESDLGIGAATGKALADPSSFWFFLQGSATSEPAGRHSSYPTPVQTIQHPPVQPISSLGPTRRPHSLQPVPVEKGIINLFDPKGIFVYSTHNILGHMRASCMKGLCYILLHKEFLRLYKRQTDLRVVMRVSIDKKNLLSPFFLHFKKNYNIDTKRYKILDSPLYKHGFFLVK